MSLRKLAYLTAKTDRLDIRPVTEADLASVFEIHRQDEVNKFLPYETWQDMQDAQAWYEVVKERRDSESAEQFVLFEGGKLVGSMIFFSYNANQRECELGYVLNKPFWGQGYMVEALNEMLPSVARLLNLEHFVATIEADNIASIKLLSRLGFSQTDEAIEKGILLKLFRSQAL